MNLKVSSHYNSRTATKAAVLHLASRYSSRTAACVMLQQPKQRRSRCCNVTQRDADAGVSQDAIVGIPH